MTESTLPPLTTIKFTHVAMHMGKDWIYETTGEGIYLRHFLVRADKLQLEIKTDSKKNQYNIEGRGNFQWSHSSCGMQAPNSINISCDKNDAQIAKAILTRLVPQWELYWRTKNTELAERLKRIADRKQMLIGLATEFPNCVIARNLDNDEPYIELKMGKAHQRLELRPAGEGDWYISGARALYIPGDIFRVMAATAEKKLKEAKANANGI